VSFAFLISDLAGNLVSEAPAAVNKRLGVRVSGIGTSGMTVRGGTADADFLLAGDALLRVYEIDPWDGARRLLAHHRLLTAEEVGEDGATVAATFVDPLWTVGRRLIGKSATGYSRGTSVAPVDRGTIISEVLTAANAESPSGLRIGTLTASTSTYVAGWFYKRASEAIAELAATLDGPDYRVRPILYEGGYIGELDVGPSLSTYRPHAAFEHGDGLLNVRRFRRAVSLEGSANRFYSLPSGFPDNAVGNVLSTEDAASIAARGHLEDVVPTDLTVDGLRAELLAAHLAVRKGPRQTISLEPVRDLGARVPKLGRDFEVGDVVPFRASIRGDDGELVKRLDVLVRVYGYDVSVDEAGYGTPTITVTPT
jgi:hypothetical protein